MMWEGDVRFQSDAYGEPLPLNLEEEIRGTAVGKVLSVLKDRGTVGAPEIAKLTELSIPTTYRALAKAQSLGLVEYVQRYGTVRSYGAWRLLD